MSVGGIAAQLTRTMVRAAARAQFMDPGGEELLAGAGFAEEQHRRVGGGDPFDLCEHRPDRLALADDRVESAALLDLAFERDVLQMEFVAQPDDFLERLLLFGDVHDTSRGSPRNRRPRNSARRCRAPSATPRRSGAADTPCVNGRRASKLFS